MRSFLKTLLKHFRRPKTLATSEDTTEVFLWMFQAHGLACSLREGWVVAESGDFGAQARVFVHPAGSAMCSIQLDVEVRTATGHRIIESCGGFGSSLHAAIGDAIKSFCDGSFHVIYSALTGEPCSHCEIEDWKIGGIPRRVYISPMVCRGQGSPGENPGTAWFDQMEQHIKRSSLPAGLHWIRLYHLECPTAKTTNEVLLDNKPWTDLQTQLGSYAWPPPVNSYYSVRMFLVIMDLCEKEAR